MKARLFFGGIIFLFLLTSCSSLPMQEFIPENPEWTMVIEPLSGDREHVTIKNSDNTSRPVVKGNSVHYENVGGKDIDLTITYAPSKEVKGALEISSTIVNNAEGWVIISMEGPSINNIKTQPDDDFILPVGTGWKLPLKHLASSPENKNMNKPWKWDARKEVYTYTSSYPSNSCTMQWAVLQGENGGMYFGCHDSGFSFKYLRASYDPVAQEAYIGFKNMLACFPGETAEVPPAVFYSYEGSWHKAADIYRNWFLANRQMLDTPEWAKNNTGWLLTILKQQNDEVIVPYDEIGGWLADAAEERGLDVLGLFGRGIGGHDRFYPDYSVDPKLGGEEAFKKGIAEAKAKGKRVILYTNGQLLDMNETPQFWPDTGRVISVVKKSGGILTQNFHKYIDAPGRHFGLACHSCQTWRDIMLRLAKEVNDLGADGILYDQLATRGPLYCYSPDHGHRVPEIVYENDRNDNMKYVQEEMSKINPDFIVMTEGVVDAQMNTIGMYHGLRVSAGIPLKSFFKTRLDDTGVQQNFPEMFRYTFPESVITIRHSNPSQTRFILNYNIMYGFRNEIELRYAADRRYIKDGIIPKEEDYGNVKGKLNLDIINEAGSPVNANRYHKQVLNFQKKHADLFMTGRFLADRNLEFDASTPYALAYAWESADGSKAGVLVWNVSDEPVNYKVSYPGYTAKSICAPDVENLKLGDALAPQSLHLVMFEK